MITPGAFAAHALVDVHNPEQRCFVHQVGSWYILRHAANDPMVSWLAPRGLLHLQLYHAPTGLSVLTPSGLTEGTYELGEGAERARYHCYGCLNGHLVREHGVHLPCLRSVRWAERWFVRAAEFGSAAVPPTPDDPN